jgi:hypothetical protein
MSRGKPFEMVMELESDRTPNVSKKHLMTVALAAMVIQMADACIQLLDALFSRYNTIKLARKLSVRSRVNPVHQRPSHS